MASHNNKQNLFFITIKNKYTNNIGVLITLQTRFFQAWVRKFKKINYETKN